MSENRIININVSKLNPHPQNPRKQIGDVSELAESLKKNGILQNLTVVPNEGCDEYTVIIGHRRCAAAKQAGISELPCAVVEMDEAKQIETMLSENMQRSDLTVYEQAEGFQMLLDLGFSIPDVAEKTGFSESTVRRRTSLLVLDKDKFEASQDRNPTLEDYAELSKIDDVDERNRLLEYIGTNNFNNEIKKAYDVQEKNKEFDEIESLLSEHAVKIDEISYSRYQWIMNVYRIGDIPKVFDENSEYVYTRGSHSFCIYKKKPEKSIEEKCQEDKKFLEEQRKNKEFQQNADDITERMHNLRVNFLREYVGKKGDTSVIIKALLEQTVEVSDYGIDYEDLLQNVGVVFDDEYGCVNLEDIYNRAPRKVLLAVTLARMGEKDRISYIYKWDRDKPYEQNIRLNKIYNLLTKLGYQMSDEEIKLKEGTHEIFMVSRNEATTND